MIDQILKQEDSIFESKQKKKNLAWKKILVLAGATTLAATAISLTTWGFTKSYINKEDIELPPIKYKEMNVKEFNNLHSKFYGIKNHYIKSLATEQLMFYLPKSVYDDLEYINPYHNLNNINSIIGQKLLNTVSSNMRVWGLNVGYCFDPNLVEFEAMSLSPIKDSKPWETDGGLVFDYKLGYKGTNKTFELKGEFLKSDEEIEPISEFNNQNVQKVFALANERFKREINRNGYFVGLNFEGDKGPDNKENPEKAFEWLGDQTVDLQEFNSQTWDYVLNSLKNFNLVKEYVFVDGINLFNIDGWNLDKIYVKDKSQVKIDKNKNEVRLGKSNSFGPHSIVSMIDVNWKADKNITFEFWGSYLQNNQWGNY